MQKCSQGLSILLVFHILADMANGNFVAHNLVRHANRVTDFIVWMEDVSPHFLDVFLANFGYFLMKVQSRF